MNWRPPRSPIGLIALAALMIVLVAVDIVLAVTLLRSDINLRAFSLGLLIALSLPILALLAYWLWGALTLRYTLDRNSLDIHWVGTEHVVPMAQIRALIPGSEILVPPVVRGLRWPGYTIGEADVSTIGRTLFFATRPLAEQVIVVTPNLAYAISPGDPALFIDEVTARQRLGPTDYVPQTVRVAPWLARPIWRDRLSALLFGLGALACLALFAWVAYLYPTLPDALFLRGIGQPSSPQRVALVLPTIGLLALLGNTVLAALFHTRERVAAYLLLGGALGTQMMLWVAALRGLT